MKRDGVAANENTYGGGGGFKYRALLEDRFSQRVECEMISEQRGGGDAAIITGSS